MALLLPETVGKVSKTIKELRFSFVTDIVLQK